MTKKQLSPARKAQSKLSYESLEQRELMAADFGNGFAQVPVDPRLTHSIEVETVEVSSHDSEVTESIRVDKAVDSAFDHDMVDQGLPSDVVAADDLFGSLSLEAWEPLTNPESAQRLNQADSYRINSEITAVTDLAIGDFNAGEDLVGGYCGVGIWGGTPQ